MRCGECATPVAFLVQLYCPLDHEKDAFHRCLYIFCCPKATCSKNSSAKALRCQLPRANAFYPYEPDDQNKAAEAADNYKEAKQLAGADPTAWGVTLCCVCGQRAKSACSRCKSARYCGKQHQTEHWKRGGHKQVCTPSAASVNDAGKISANQNYALQGEDRAKFQGKGKGSSGPAPTTTSISVFREFEVDVQPEPALDPTIRDEGKAKDTLACRMDLGSTDDISGGGGCAPDEEDEDSKLSQAELDKIAGVHGVKDKVTLQFLKRTQANPQVIRYDTAGGAALWSSSKGVPGETDIPPCEGCGQARRFEFQVMPHLLHYLGVDAKSEALDAKAAISQGRRPGSSTAGGCMDWGTLAVYTCPDSCPADNSPAWRGSFTDKPETTAVASYLEEFVWRQPPP
ncbi:unnamed protein product [Ascophyllum nodosum]